MVYQPYSIIQCQSAEGQQWHYFIHGKGFRYNVHFRTNTRGKSLILLPRVFPNFAPSSSLTVYACFLEPQSPKAKKESPNYEIHNIYIIIIMIVLNFLTLFLSSIVSDWSSRRHTVSTNRWCIWVILGRSTLARPCVGVQKRMSLMTSSLLLRERNSATGVRTRLLWCHSSASSPRCHGVSLAVCTGNSILFLHHQVMLIVRSTLKLSPAIRPYCSTLQVVPLDCIHCR